MKKRYWIYGLIILILVSFAIFEKPREMVAQSYETLSLRFIQQKDTGWITLDGANTYSTVNIPFVDTRLKGVAWGSFTLWVRVDSLKAGTAEDSLQIWFKELQADTTTVSAFDSTSVGTFDWATGSEKKYTIIPDCCFGLKFSMKHTTIIDDSIKVRYRLAYQ